uniref:AXH domain-containing protein n=1 Tax=Oncorhynchus tshawytscha TaxID=74940 RepID=A0A8C8HQE7_ONCTS
MKPGHERNQECLPPKKRDLNNSTSSSSAGGGAGSGVGGGGESAEGLQGLPVDQYSMLYRVALPSVSYSQTSLHPVLSHISPAYTVPSSLLQHHPGISYPPLGYAQIPHSSFQFVSPYGAVPYAVPPGFVPSSLISPSGTLSQPHLVPYQSVIQEGVVSPPTQTHVSAHAFAKVGSSGGVPLMLTSEQAAQHQQHLGALPAAELSPRGVPVFYHSRGTRAAPAPWDPYSGEQETDGDREVNGGEREQAAREMLQDSVYNARNARLLQAASASAALEHAQDRSLKSRRLDERASPGQRSTPDTDLEVQQVVGCLASPVQGVSGGRKEVSFGPLNLSQGSQRGREAHGEAGESAGRTGYAIHPAVYGDPRVMAHQQQAGQPGHAVILANGQTVLVPLDYHHLPHQHQQAVVELATAPAPTPTPSNPSHFMKGAIIQLATGELKRVEDLQTQDFVRSAEVSGGLKIDSSMVVDIRTSQQRPGLVVLHFTVGEQQSKVTIDVPPEHPFFVFGQGWSSCSPERTAQLYGLACHHLQVGDVCVSITLQTSTKANSTSGAIGQPMGPPAPQQPRPHSYYLHTEGSVRPGAGVGVVSTVSSASQRRWSAPGLQRCMKVEEGGHPQLGSSRPSFIPQEVKLSIEGRSNAGK